MSAGRPPFPPRRTLAGVDPRAERSDTPAPADLRDIVMRLANAELERAQYLPRLEAHLESIAAGVNALVSARRFDDAARERQESIHDIALAVAEATGSHHVPTQTSYPPFLRDWKGPLKLTRKVAMLLLTGACATAGGVAFGYAMRDCQHAPPAAAHP